MRRLVLALLVFLLPLGALAQDLPKPLSNTVNDFGNLLTPEAEARLDTLLAKARVETGIQVVLVTLGRREDFGGQGRSIEDYAKALFNAWGVGDAKRNDGILILVSKDDREMRIQLGAGFDAAWNGVAQGVIDSAFLPAFKAGDYGKGIETGTAEVLTRIARAFGAGKKAPAYTPRAPKTVTTKTESSDRFDQVFTLFLPFIMVAVALSAMRNVIGDFLIRMKPCPKCGKKGLQRSRMVVDQPSYVSTGRGLMTTTCDFCDYRVEQAYSIPSLRDRNSDNDRGSRSGGSRSGGSGGGRSSGGGATGRW